MVRGDDPYMHLIGRTFDLHSTLAPTLYTKNVWRKMGADIFAIHFLTILELP